jgi:DNA invertase Pin-like site-specific DNA recombinase
LIAWSPVREGDELIVLKLDRLGRNTRDVLNLVHDLRQRGAILSVLEPKLATTDFAGPILVTVLGMVAELERSFIRERQKAGIDAARKRGVYKGRKPTVPVERVKAMHRDGVGPSAIARELAISRADEQQGSEWYRQPAISQGTRSVTTTPDQP